MAKIIEAKKLLDTEAPSATSMEMSETLVERLNARLVHARSQGASCIVLKPEDGFVIFHGDRTKKHIPEQVLAALRALDEAGYIFSKDTTPNGAPSLRVYFGSAPSTNRVTIVELESWAKVTE